MNHRLAKLLLLSIALHLAVFAAFTVAQRTPRMDLFASLSGGHIGPLAIEWEKETKQLSRQNNPSSASRTSAKTIPSHADPNSASPRYSGTALSAAPGSESGSSTGPISVGSTDPYYSEVRARIESHIHYPPAFARRRLQGQVEVALTLLANGSISTLNITRSSGTTDLDQLALDSVRAAGPFPAFQPATPARKLELPINFRLH